MSEQYTIENFTTDLEAILAELNMNKHQVDVGDEIFGVMSGLITPKHPRQLHLSVNIDAVAYASLVTLLTERGTLINIDGDDDPEIQPDAAGTAYQYQNVIEYYTADKAEGILYFIVQDNRLPNGWVSTCTMNELIRNRTDNYRQQVNTFKTMCSHAFLAGRALAALGEEIVKSDNRLKTLTDNSQKLTDIWLAEVNSMIEGHIEYREFFDRVIEKCGANHQIDEPVDTIDELISKWRNAYFDDDCRHEIVSVLTYICEGVNGPVSVYDNQ